MDIRRIIEQEVDKQVWGLELPNKVKLGDETLELTDRGVYQGDDTEVEYKIEDDKVLTSDDEELVPVNESDFDWTSDIGDSDELAMLNSFSIYIPNGFNQMEQLSRILIDHFPENGGGLTDGGWPTLADLQHITKNGTEPIWIEVDKEITPENTWYKTWKPMPGRETIPGSVNNTGEPNSTIIQAKNVVDNFNTINESEFEWISEVDGGDFHIGTKFRYWDNEYNYNSEKIYKIIGINPNGKVDVEVNNLMVSIEYDKMKYAFDHGKYENISVRDTIDTLIYPGSKFIIENTWWEGERDGVRHPKEEGKIVLELTDVDEYGDIKYKVIESELPSRPVGSEGEIEINKLRTYIRTDWWKPYNS